MAKKLKNEKLNPKQKKFCTYYVTEEFFCNGTESYMKVYPNASYDSARVEASKFLTNPNILDYIDSLLNDMGLNNQRVDKELAKLILQDEDKNIKIRAIGEYNKIKSRISEKREVTIKFNPEEIKKMSDDELTKLLNS